MSVHDLDVYSLNLKNPDFTEFKISIYQHTDRPKSVITKRHLPQFFDFEKSKLVEFVQFYYEWMEQFGPDKESSLILKVNDIDFRTIGHDEFDIFLKNEFLKDFPHKLEVDQRFLIKHIKDFYRAKGSEDALKLLFKILYNDDIEITYPGEKILRASHGKWLIEKSMKVALYLSDINQISQYDFVVGVTSNAVAKIQRIEQTILNDKIEIEIFFDGQNGEFIENENIASRLTGEIIGRIEELVVYPGKWMNSDGWLSSDMRLQDNYYYQEFSYVIKTSLPINSYRDVIKKLAHPAGTIFFSEYMINIEIDNSIDTEELLRQYSKMIDYDIDLWEFMKLSLESGQTTGEYTSQFEFYYDYVLDQISIDFPNYEIISLTFSGEVEDTWTLKNSDGFGDVEAGDTIEIRIDSDNITYYAKVGEVVSNTEIKVLYEIPYVSNNATFSLIKDDHRPKAETITFVNTFGEIQEDVIEIGDMNSFQEVKDYTYQTIKDMKLSDMLQKKFLKRTVPDFNDENIVENTIMYLYNNINTDESYHFVYRIWTPTLLQIKDEYTSSPANDLNYRIINI